jgi:hypothetical protein
MRPSTNSPREARDAWVNGSLAAGSEFASGGRRILRLRYRQSALGDVASSLVTGTDSCIPPSTDGTPAPIGRQVRPLSTE